MIQDYINQSFIYFMTGRKILKVQKQVGDNGRWELTKETVEIQDTWGAIHNPPAPGYDIVIDGEQVKLAQIADYSTKDIADFLQKGEVVYVTPSNFKQVSTIFDRLNKNDQKALAERSGTVLLSEL
jgi:hypothetical protein